MRREVNDRIYDVAAHFSHPDEWVLQFVCECGISGCALNVPMTLAEYAGTRRGRDQVLRFTVAREHELSAAGVVVERHASYVILEQPLAHESRTKPEAGC